MKWKPSQASRSHPPGPATASSPSRRPERRLRERNIGEEHIPPQAKVWIGQLNEQVLAIAVLIYNMVINPITKQRWNNQGVDGAARVAFGGAVADGQIEAVDQSTPEDQEYLEKATAADISADHAGAGIEETKQILGQTVEFPPGSRCTAREAISEHQGDRRLAAEREADGDTEHQKRAIERAWGGVAAGVLSGLELILLWRPVIGLGGIDSSDALIRWVIAVLLSGAQAFFIEAVVHRFRDRERDATDRRDAVGDHNRRVKMGLYNEDLAAVALPPPDLEDVAAADARLRGARAVLNFAAGGVGLIAIIRVAFMVRSAGRTVVEATLFGAIVGLILGGMVVMLGLILCRGNRLGDKLRAGAEVVAEIETAQQDGANQVADARDVARLELAAADEARVWAEETREWVVDQYRQALLFATRMLGLTQPPVAMSDLVVRRELRVAAAGEAKVKEVTLKLAEVDKWLAAPRRLLSEEPATPGTDLVLASTTVDSPLRVVRAPAIGQQGAIVPAGLRIEPRPAAPRWLLPVTAAACLVIAWGAAMIAPPPEGFAQVAQTISGVISPTVQ